MDTCSSLEAEFNLMWSESLQLYLLDSATSVALTSQTRNISFTFGNDLTPESSNVTIDIPVQAFNLTLTKDFPGVTRETSYFPVRRASNSSQYTLGRAFLQHAYVIADYERSSISVHQALFPSTPRSQLKTISPPAAITSSALNPPSSDNAQRPAIANVPGLIVGIVLGVVFLLLGAILRWRRWKRKHSPRAGQATVWTPGIVQENAPPSEIEGLQKNVSELQYGKHQAPELHATSRLPELPRVLNSHERDHQAHHARELE